MLEKLFFSVLKFWHFPNPFRFILVNITPSCNKSVSMHWKDGVAFTELHWNISHILQCWNTNVVQYILMKTNKRKNCFNKQDGQSQSWIIREKTNSCLWLTGVKSTRPLSPSLNMLLLYVHKWIGSLKEFCLWDY